MIACHGGVGGRHGGAANFVMMWWWRLMADGLMVADGWHSRLEVRGREQCFRKEVSSPKCTSIQLFRTNKLNIATLADENFGGVGETFSFLKP